MNPPLSRTPCRASNKFSTLSGGPWAGRPCIGKSLAVGPGGGVLARGPYGVDAEALVVVEVEPRRPVAEGADIAAALHDRGYDGP